MAESARKIPDIFELENMEKDLKTSSEKLYEKLVKENEPLFDEINKIDKMLEKAHGIPYETKQNLYKMTNVAKESSGRLLKVIKSYSKTEEELEKIYKEWDFINKTDAIQKTSEKGAAYMSKLGYRIEELNKKKGLDYQSMAKLSKDIVYSLEDVKNIVDHYREKVEKNGTKAANVVALSIIGVFGATVFYALSQINPENTTVGAFTAGAVSPNLAIIFTAVVVFLAFFLTHHKLK